MAKRLQYVKWSGRAAAACFAVGTTAAVAEIQFQDVTSAVGITDTGETYGSGLFDADGDGYPEFFMNKHQYTNSVFYRNVAGPTGRRFENVAGTVLTGEFNILTDSHGMSAADWDNDGDQDIMEVTGAGYGFPLWENDGSGNFINRITQLGFEYPITWARVGRMPTGGRTPLFFDYTGDGKLDVLITARDNYRAYRTPTAMFRQDTGPDGSPLFVIDESTGVDLVNDVGCHYALLAELTGDDIQDVICADSSSVSRVWDVSQSPFQELRPIIGDAFYNAKPADFAVGDFNGDLRTDLFAPGSASSTNVVSALDSRAIAATFSDTVTFDSGFIFTASGAVTFEFDWWTRTEEVFLGSAGTHPANSNYLPTYVGQAVGAAPRHLKFTLTAAQAQGLAPRDFNLERGIYIGVVNGQWQVRLTGTGTWEVNMIVRAENSITELSNLGATRVGQPTGGSPLLFLQNASHQLVNSSNRIQSINRSCKSAAAGDFDNDMDLDVYVGCTGDLANLPNIIYENQGDGTFVPVPLAGGAEGQFPEGRHDTVSLGDYDQDGKLDVFVTNGHLFRPFSYAGKQQLFRNTGGTGNHWTQADLEGVASNRDGIGAIIYATTPDGKVQKREQGNGIHKKSQDYQRLHLGLAGNTRVNLEVRWPSGTVDTFAGLAADQVHRLVEGTGSTAPYLVSVGDESVSEAAGSVSFDVALSPAPGAGQAVQVSYQTADETATAGTDYTATSGTLTFGPGETAKSISVPITDDTLSEADETFGLALTGTATNEATAHATIVDDDTAVTPPACGAPTPAYNKATETAVFLWNDCGTSQWHVRATAGGQSVSFQGSLTASPAFASLTPFSFETSDRLPPNFVMNVSGTAQDGIDFSLPAGGQGCFSVNAPAGATVIAGANRVAISGGVSLPGFEPCTP
jgi:hypothetical protein